MPVHVYKKNEVFGVKSKLKTVHIHAHTDL